MKHSDDLKILATALSEFQKDVPPVLKDATNPHFQSKFASLASIVHAATPALAVQGLSVVQLPSGDTENPTLVTLLLHVSGQYIESEAPLFLDKSNSQGLGSAVTYMRRYAYCAALGIVADEDDDGEAASKTPRTRARSTPTQRPSSDPVVANQEKVANLAAQPPLPAGDEATIPQLNKIRLSCRDLGFAEDGTDVAAIVNEKCPPWPGGLAALTKGQASTLIDALVK